MKNITLGNMYKGRPAKWLVYFSKTSAGEITKPQTQKTPSPVKERANKGN
jgi:hypothetical protein